MRPNAIFSWLVILIIALGLPGYGAYRNAARRAAASSQPSGVPATQVASEPSSGPSTQTAPSSRAKLDPQTQIQVNYFLGIGKILPGSPEKSVEALEDAATTPAQHIAAAVLAGELSGRAEAIPRLKALDPNPDAADFWAWYEHSTPLPADVEARYGFVATLAKAIDQPAGNADRDAVAGKITKIKVAIALIFFLLIVGVPASLGLFITAIVLISTGKIRFQEPRPTGPAETYVEGFAVYLGLFLIGGIGVGLLLPKAPFILHAAPVVLAFLLGILWPLFRGGSWVSLIEDWGIHTGKGVVSEVLAGIGGYLAFLPVVAFAALITFGLSWLTGEKPSHPIQSEITNNPVLLALLAVVFAPISEELMFRGVLLSHLRSRLGPILSALITAFIFAAIHPQGWAAIPMLGSIGFMLACIRQWRRSLIPSMTAHALNNGVVVALLLLMA